MMHVLTGVKTNCVVAWAILDRDAADSPQFAPLVKEASKHFNLEEVSADKAYAAEHNFAVVDECGGTAYLAFKEGPTGGIGGLFGKMVHYFSLNKEKYLTSYHQRRNVESTFRAIKRQLGDLIRGKTPVARKNEMLAKLVAYPSVCVIHEMYDLGLTPDFWPQAPIGQPPAAPESHGTAETAVAHQPTGLPTNFSFTSSC